MSHKYQIVTQDENGRFVVDTTDDILAYCEVRGIAFVKMNTNHRHRIEIQGEPVFASLCGPMWGGEKHPVRYECARANDTLSR